MNRTTLAAWAALTVLGCTGAPALAQDTEADVSAGLDAEARGVFEAGRAAYADGRYEAALEYFERAHELSGRTTMLFNVGQAAERARRDARAIEAFEAYLQAMPDAPNREMVKNRLAALRDLNRAGGEDTPATSDAAAQKAEPTEQPASDSAGAEPQAAADVTAEADSEQTAPATGHARMVVALGVGGGLFALSSEADESSGLGVGTGGDLSFGWAPWQGIYFTAGVNGGSASQLEFEDGDDGKASAQLFGFELGVDWYPFRNAGWHALASLGGYRLNIEEVDGSGDLQIDEDVKPAGAGLSFGLGHDWRMRNGFLFGALVRWRLAPLTDQGDVFSTHTLLAMARLSYGFGGD